jgi:hypothetical protein
MKNPFSVRAAQRHLGNFQGIISLVHVSLLLIFKHFLRGNYAMNFFLELSRISCESSTSLPFLFNIGWSFLIIDDILFSSRKQGMVFYGDRRRIRNYVAGLKTSWVI